MDKKAKHGTGTEAGLGCRYAKSPQWANNPQWAQDTTDADFDNNAMPVVYHNPFNGLVESMPIEMVGAYLPYAGDLDLSKAAEVACIRDDEAAQNLLLSIVENAQPEIEMSIPEGTRLDALTIEPPSLR